MFFAAVTAAADAATVPTWMNKAYIIYIFVLNWLGQWEIKWLTDWRILRLLMLFCATLNLNAWTERNLQLNDKGGGNILIWEKIHSQWSGMVEKKSNIWLTFRWLHSKNPVYSFSTFKITRPIGWYSMYLQIFNEMVYKFCIRSVRSSMRRSRNFKFYSSIWRSTDLHLSISNKNNSIVYK